MMDMMIDLSTATMLGWRELEENREKVITCTTGSLLLLQTDGFIAPCLTSSSTNLLGKLPTAKVLLPLPNLEVNMES